jgi:predicted Rossmann fold nucleotide-binding protein DprA/Smf involved in DNA uptake
MAKYQIHYLGFTDPDYPACLKDICDPPLILYYRGNLSETLNELCVGSGWNQKILLPTEWK